MPSYPLYWIIRNTSFIIFKICLAFRVKGKENIPKKGNFIIASNHISYLDPVAVGISVPCLVHFMARDDLFNIKFFGTILKNVAAFPVKRGYRDFEAMKRSLKMLKEGKVIAIFPEGTRIEAPELGEPELGIGMLAARSRVSVLPIFVKGTNEALPKHAKFMRFKPVEVRIGEPLEFKGYKDTLEKKQDYRKFTYKIMESISNLRDSI